MNEILKQIQDEKSKRLVKGFIKPYALLEEDGNGYKDFCSDRYFTKNEVQLISKTIPIITFHETK